MAVPPEMMDRLKQGGAHPLPGGAAPGPAGAPMANPVKKDGNEEIGRVQVHVAMNMLEKAIGAFLPDSKEYKGILKTLSALAKDFGENDTSDLHPAEIQQMVKSMPQQGGAPAAQQAAMKPPMPPPGAGAPQPPPMM